MLREGDVWVLRALPVPGEGSCSCGLEPTRLVVDTDVVFSRVGPGRWCVLYPYGELLGCVAGVPEPAPWEAGTRTVPLGEAGTLAFERVAGEHGPAIRLVLDPGGPEVEIPVALVPALLAAGPAIAGVSFLARARRYASTTGSSPSVATEEVHPRHIFPRGAVAGGLGDALAAPHGRERTTV